MALNHSPSIVTNGLVLYLDAANRRSYPGSGTSWFDLSGNNNHGTLTNGPTFSSANGGGIVFDGNNDYIFVPNGYTNILKNNNTWSISLWIMASSLTNNPVLISPDAGQLAYYDLFLEIGSNAVYFASGGGSGGYLDNIATPLVTNTMYNIVFIKNGISSGKVYVNQNEILLTAQGSGLGSMPNLNADLRIGGFKEGSFYFNGIIYSCTMYNKAITPLEIAQNYNATKGRFGL